jgi:O-antigen ligase
MALAAYFLLAYALQSQHKWRWLLFILAALASINLLLMTEGRSGYLVFGSLSLLLIYQHWRWRGLLLISGLFLLMGSVLLTQFNIVQRYSEHVMQDIRAYDAGERVNSNALRYDFLRNGVQIATQAPFFGHGTGSFAMVYRTHIVTYTQHQHFSHNPHNEYLMISIQWGGLGLLGWLLLLLFMWRNSLRLPPMWQWQAQAFVLTFVIGSLVNSLLLDSTEGHLFAFLAALFCTLPSQQVHTNAKKSASGNNHHTTYAEESRIVEQQG